MNEVENARKMFTEGHSCSQSILATFADRFNLDRNTALKLACSFGGGMGRQGMTCGAVTGSVMVLGLAAGRVDPDDEEARNRSDALVQKFFRRFKEKHASLNCNELTGVEMACPEARSQANEAGTFDKVCPGLVGFAAEVVTELLELEKPGQ